jgi:hypothetical protein
MNGESEGSCSSRYCDKAYRSGDDCFFQEERGRIDRMPEDRFQDYNKRFFCGIFVRMSAVERELDEALSLLPSGLS